MDRSGKLGSIGLYVGACLVLALIAGSVYYYAYHPIPIVDTRNWVRAGHTDEKGNFVQTGIFQQPKPDVYRMNGLLYLPEYSKRMVDKDSPDASLIISSLEGNKSCLLMRQGASVVIMEGVEIAPPARAEKAHLKKVRTFFKSLGIKETKDDIHEYNGVANAMEDLEYPIGNDPAVVAQVTQRFLKEIYGVLDHEGLSFEFERTRPAAEQGANEFILERRP